MLYNYGSKQYNYGSPASLQGGGGREMRVLRPFVGGEGDESRFAWKVESRDAEIK